VVRSPLRGPRVRPRYFGMRYMPQSKPRVFR
jgi:hypothetical protein